MTGYPGGFNGDGVPMITEAWLLSIGCVRLPYKGPSCGREYSLGRIKIHGYQTFDKSLPNGHPDSEIIGCWINAFNPRVQLLNRYDFIDACNALGYVFLPADIEAETQSPPIEPLRENTLMRYVAADGKAEWHLFNDNYPELNGCHLLPSPEPGAIDMRGRREKLLEFLLQSSSSIDALPRCHIHHVISCYENREARKADRAFAIDFMG